MANRRIVSVLIGGAALALVAQGSAVTVPGGGKGAKKNDCYSEFLVTGGTAKGKNGVVCTDCDPSCDKDGVATANGSCTVEVEVCAHQADSTLPSCTSPTVTSYDKLSPGTLLVPTTPAAAAACGAVNSVTAAVKKGGKKAGAKVKLRAKATGGHPAADVDTLQVFCAPPVGACPTTTTTSTTTTTTTSTTIVANGTFDFTTTTGTGNCGDSKDGTGTVIKTLTCGGLDLGGGGVQSPVPEGPTPDGATNRFTIVSQSSSTLYNFGSTPTNGSGFLCTDTGCHYGPPLPIPNGNTSVCVVNTFSAPGSGTFDTGTGEASASVPLASAVIITGNIVVSGSPQPCPICVSGTCTTGTNHGQACTSTNSQGLTIDCPPGGSTCRSGANAGLFCTANSDCPSSNCQASTDIGAPIAVDLTPLKTGTTSKTSDSLGNFCPGQDNTAHQGCFNDSTCRLVEETGTPAGALTDNVAKAATFASVFCIPVTGNILVDDVATGLPGPGATTLPSTIIYHILP